MMNKQPEVIQIVFISALLSQIFMPLTVSANHSWSNYHWARTHNPMELQVINSVTSEWQTDLDITISDWNQANALDMKITSSNNSTKIRKRCNATSGKIRVCNAAYGNNGWLGLATINVDSSGHITKGTAKMNDSYASYWEDPNEKAHVMCQEVGHLFGLGHTSEDGTIQKTCMDYSNSSLSTMTNDHDIELLNDIYTHSDSYDSFAIESGGTTEPTPCRGGPKKCGSGSGSTTDNGNSDFGRGHLIRSNEFYEEWVEYYADGSKTVYHVTLAH